MKTLALLLLTTLTLTAQVVYDDGLLQAKSSTLLQGLQGYWRLEEASGTRYDRSKNGNHLTAVNSPGQAAGVSSATGNCATFASGSTQSLSITDNASLRTSSNSFTVALWANMTNIAATQIFQAKGNGSVYDEFALYYSQSTSRIRMAYGNNSTLPANNLGAPAQQTWYFVVGWYDASQGKLFLQVNNGTADSSNVTAQANSANPFKIGSSSVAGQYMNGFIDEVGFWNRALTAAERTQLYRSGGGVTHPQFHARELRNWRRWEPEYPTLVAWINRKHDEVIDL